MKSFALCGCLFLFQPVAVQPVAVQPVCNPPVQSVVSRVLGAIFPRLVQQVSTPPDAKQTE